MKMVTSRDGTTIAFDQLAKGKAVIHVDGAMDYRNCMPYSQRKTLKEQMTLVSPEALGPVPVKSFQQERALS